MVRVAILLALAVTLVVAADETSNEKYKTFNVASKEYLQKQKLVYDLLYRYTQPKLNEELQKTGTEYSIRKNIDSYNDKEAVEHFLKHYENGGLLHHDSIYSVYYYPHETMAIFRVLYAAKDFDTFYKTALNLKTYANHNLYVYAVYLAVIHRPDTKYIRLPHLYEIAPYLFYNSELLEQAHHYEYFGQKENNHSGYQTYVIPYNYSGHYLHDDYDTDYESLINYLTEDIGWNEYYFYYRNEYPYLLNSQEFGLNNKYRGEEYFYGHRQILSRYFLERFANGMNIVEHFDFHGEFQHGFYPTFTYPNGLPFPVRPSNTKLPKNKQHDIYYAMAYETRLLDAVDSGYVLNKNGEKVNVYTKEGLNILGNLVEGNADSYNKQYYGNIDRDLRHILGFSFETSHRNEAHPSALEHFSTSMRDPAFYRIYFKLDHFYDKYQENQGPYKAEEIQFPELKLLQVKVGKLVTFFDSFDSTISNGLAASSKEVADTVLIKARQSRLNHKPFSVNITINTVKPVKASVKVFIAPKYDVHGRTVDLETYNLYYYELDNFVYDLEAGVNTIVRDNFDYVSDEAESYQEYYNRVVKALETGTEFTYEKRIASFPSRLLLPKGRPDGLPLNMFVHVAPVEGEPLLYQSRVFGDSYKDNRAFGYPLDRPVIKHDFVGPNMLMQEVRVYHV